MMKKIISIIAFSLVLFSPLYSQTEDTAETEGKNDVVISELTEKDTTITTYTHIQNLNGFEKSYPFYKNPSETEKIIELPDSTPVKILQIQVQTDLKTEAESVWYKIEAENSTGWIKTDYNPYKDGHWSIIETITADGKEKTVRKASGKYKLLTFHDKGERVTLYSSPSSDSGIILSTAENEQSVTVIAMTDEKEICRIYGNHSEYWVKIRLNDTEGWIFGEQLESGRGGPKYYDIPSASISLNLEISLL